MKKCPLCGEEHEGQYSYCALCDHAAYTRDLTYITETIAKRIAKLEAEIEKLKDSNIH
jgi:DNA repair exonuclease SbcCD ATPase subunit